VPLTVCAVKTACHIPTIDESSSSSSRFVKRCLHEALAGKMRTAPTYRFHYLFDNMHCASAFGIITKASARGYRNWRRFPELVLMCFLRGRDFAGYAQIKPRLAQEGNEEEVNQQVKGFGEPPSPLNSRVSRDWLVYTSCAEVPLPSALSGSILQFADFQLDCGRFELRCGDRIPAHLERKPMELLILLASP